jgi:acylglycerol lipase
MKHIEGNFKGAQGLNIYSQAWLPERNVKAGLLIVHGLGEHSGRYANVVNRFVPLGYAVYGFDHIGHGKSEGGREIIARFEDFTDTLAVYCGLVKNRQPGQPIFLLGHSLGGLIASDYLLDHSADFQGAVISAPPVKVGDAVSPLTVAVGRILSILAPRVGVLPVDPAGLSHDPAVVQAYIADPLVYHKKTPARTAAEMLRALRRVGAGAGTITLPFIALQGSADRIVDPGSAQFLYENAGSKDKTLKIYDGFYHEVFNEVGRERVLADVEAWLEARTSPAGGRLPGAHAGR